MKYCLFIALFFVQNALFAGSIKLVNNSLYDLKAVISGNDNTSLGEVIVGKNSFVYWSDIPDEEGYLGGPENINKNHPYSYTPYRVLWLCMNGSEFALCEVVHTGSTVNAKDCPGVQICKPSVEE